MNPETKLIIDEITRRFTEHDQKWDSRFADQEARITRQIQILEQAQETRIANLERVTASLDEWRPSIEGTVDDIKLDVSKSKLEVNKISRNWERAVLEQPPAIPGILTSAPTAAAKRTLVGAPAILPNGHHVEHNHRESGFGVVSTLVHSPVKGMPLPPPPPPNPSVHMF
jgi:hypothetical protein